MALMGFDSNKPKNLRENLNQLANPEKFFSLQLYIFLEIRLI